MKETIASVPAVRLDRVTKRYKSYTALNDLSLLIPEKKIFGLLGPNGAGKTTLLRILTGLLAPTEGKVTLFGKYSPGTLEARKLIGYMPQNLALYPGLTVEENLQFYGRLFGLRNKHLEQRIDETLEVVELADRRDDQIGTLSGGMVRRALLGTALIHRPRFLLLDEPTAGIDPLLRIRIWEILRGLCDDGISILITTHHISEAIRCDRTVFLRNGGIIADGPPRELMAQYGVDDLEEAFVASVAAATGEEASRP